MLVFARIEASSDEELLRLMKQAGVYRVYLGIESVTDAALTEYHKGQTVAGVVESLETLYSHGLEVFASLVLGADADTKESVRETFDFLVRHGVHAICMLALYDFPTKERTLGVPQAIAENRFIHNDWRFFNGNFVIHFPQRMKPSSLQREMVSGTRRFYAKSRRIRALLTHGSIDYITQYQSLKPVLRTMERYATLLEHFERGMYDSSENLIADRLPTADVLRHTYRLPI